MHLTLGEYFPLHALESHNFLQGVIFFFCGMNWNPLPFHDTPRCAIQGPPT